MEVTGELSLKTLVTSKNQVAGEQVATHLSSQTNKHIWQLLGNYSSSMGRMAFEWISPYSIKRPDFSSFSGWCFVKEPTAVERGREPIWMEVLGTESCNQA